MAILRQSKKRGLLKMGGLSLILHIALVAFLSLTPWPSIIKVHPSALTVTLMPVVLPESQNRIVAPPPAIKEEHPKPIEKVKPVEKPKKDDIVEKIKKKEKVPSKRLQEEIEEIRKKAALEEIQKRVARRERVEEKPKPTPPITTPVTPSPPTPPPPVAKTSAPSPLPPSYIESKLNEYYSMIWAKIKEAWTIPENLLKETVDLEAIIVIIIEHDGKVQKSWFEKKSGNSLYDQMAMRAILKAEPLPPIPKELNQKTLEIGIRFFPD